MGVVFRALDERQGREVALKILRKSTPEAARRLAREARATEGIDPDRVPRVYEVGETAGGEPFLAMEYIEGRTLREIVRAGVPPRDEALYILRELATTLAQAHRAGLVHRDVKPDNVIVRPDGPVVLLDFGIVKHLSPTHDVSQITTQLTTDGAMVGTPAYLAPEQALGRDVGPAADQFALAVTAYELLAGKLPWTSTEVTRVLAQVLADTPPSVSTTNSAVPRTFDAVLLRGLAKSPEERFSSVEAFAQALDAAERGEAPLSPASTTFEGPSPPSAIAKAVGSTNDSPARKRRFGRPLALGSLVALVGGLVAVKYGLPSTRAPNTPRSRPAIPVVS
ncbi:MAG TPA: serine/threonine-protein kinase, partial [Polyangiaceae bacterium]